MTTFSTTRRVVSHQVEADASLDALAAEAMAHPGVQHPFLTRLAKGAFRDVEAVLRRFACEYSGYAEWSARFLERAALRMVRPEHRLPWQARLAEEQGQLHDDTCQALRRIGIHPRTVQGIPRAALFKRFACSLGIAEWELAEPMPAASSWRTRLWQFLTDATPAEAVGALAIGSEHVGKAICKQVLRGIIDLGSMRRDAFVFFDLHCLAASPHVEDLSKVAEELAAAPGGLRELRAGMLAASQLRCEFWDRLYVGAMESECTNPTPLTPPSRARGAR